MLGLGRWTWLILVWGSGSYLKCATMRTEYGGMMGSFENRMVWYAVIEVRLKVTSRAYM
jgi:hypothetical protein